MCLINLETDLSFHLNKINMVQGVISKPATFRFVFSVVYNVDSTWLKNESTLILISKRSMLINVAKIPWETIVCWFSVSLLSGTAKTKISLDGIGLLL